MNTSLPREKCAAFIKKNCVLSLGITHLIIQLENKKTKEFKHVYATGE